MLMRIPNRSLTLARIVLLAIVACLPSCKSTKALTAGGQTAKSAKADPTSLDVCRQKVRFYSEKLLVVKTGQAMEVKTEITVDPIAKIVHLKAEAPGEEKADFDTNVESFECHFNDNFTTGWALYSGYIKQQDGSLTKSIVKLEAKDGMLQFSNGDPEKVSDMIIYVSKWEVLDQQ